MSASVILKSLVGEQRIRIYDANNKEHIFHWNEKNNYQLEVPTVMTCKDAVDPEKMVVFAKNLAQHLLDTGKDLNPKSPTYRGPSFELVQIVEKPVVEAPVVVDRRKKSKENKSNEVPV